MLVRIPCPNQAGPSSALLFGKVPMSVRLEDGGHCTLSLPAEFIVTDPDTGETGRCLRAPLGTSFSLEYAGRECEVRVGRRIVVRDAL